MVSTLSHNLLFADLLEPKIPDSSSENLKALDILGLGHSSRGNPGLSGNYPTPWKLPVDTPFVDAGGGSAEQVVKTE